MSFTQIDEAAADLLRLASGRAVRPPMALLVITATQYAYRRQDGDVVAPLAPRGP